MGFLEYNLTFRQFGWQHGMPVAIFLAVLVGLLSRASKTTSINGKWQIARGIAWLVFLSIVMYIAIRLYLGDFRTDYDLPFDLCNAIGILLPVAAVTRSKPLHQVLYFWVLAGTFQAIVAPDLQNGFPSFSYIKFWVLHLGIVLYSLYTAGALDMLPSRPAHVWKSYGFFQLYIAFAFLMNALFSANYMYLMKKPTNASPLDWFGAWPIYLLVAEIAFLGLFWIIYAVTRLLARKRKGA